MAEIERELRQKYKLTLKEIKEYQRATLIRRQKEAESLKELGLLSGTKILECGTGRGRFTEDLRDDILNPKQILYTVDSNTQTIKYVFNRFKGKSPKAKCEWKVYSIIADICRLPFQNNSFDTVVSHYILHGIKTKDRNFLKAYQEMERVLKSGRTVIAMTFYFDGKQNYFAYLRHKLFQLEYKDQRINFCGLKRPEDYLNYFRRAGFKKIECEKIEYPSSPFFEKIAEKIFEIDLADQRKEIEKIKSDKLKRQAEKVWGEFKDYQSPDKFAFGPTILIWGKK
jgi:ubiquinone/menaquinone biosynthesis C-methylase UbiE